jgi:putative endonuclease
MRTYTVYLLANRKRRLYIGVTSNLTRRLHQHRAGTGSRFAARYAITRLVLIEAFASPLDAIAREKQLKKWSRWKKLALIEAGNPQWEDLGRYVLGTPDGAGWRPDSSQRSE